MELLATAVLAAAGLPATLSGGGEAGEGKGRGTQDGKGLVSHHGHMKGSMDQEGGELGIFQFLKHNKATLTYAMLVRHQFTNWITKLPTQTKRNKMRSKA